MGNGYTKEDEEKLTDGLKYAEYLKSEGVTFDDLASDFYDMLNEVKQLKAENKGLRAEWFKKGQNSIKRKNKSGCCCMINEDDEIENLCALHKEYIQEALEG